MSHPIVFLDFQKHVRNRNVFGVAKRLCDHPRLIRVGFVEMADWYEYGDEVVEMWVEKAYRLLTIRTVTSPDIRHALFQLYKIARRFDLKSRRAIYQELVNNHPPSPITMLVTGWEYVPPLHSVFKKDAVATNN